MRDDDAREESAFHLLGEIDITGPQRDATHDTVPCLRGEGTTRRGEERDDSQDKKGSDAEHKKRGLQRLRDGVKNVQRPFDLCACCLEADRYSQLCRQSANMLQIMMTTEVAAPTEDALCIEVDCQSMRIQVLHGECHDSAWLAIDESNL